MTRGMDPYSNYIYMTEVPLRWLLSPAPQKSTPKTLVTEANLGKCWQFLCYKILNPGSLDSLLKSFHLNKKTARKLPVYLNISSFVLNVCQDLLSWISLNNCRDTLHTQTARDNDFSQMVTRWPEACTTIIIKAFCMIIFKHPYVI